MNIKLITVCVNMEMYQRFFLNNPLINVHDLLSVDNRLNNIGLPEIYNKIIESNLESSCWLFFVHEDFEIKGSLCVIDCLDQNCVYGTFGVNLENGYPVPYGKHVCSNKDGSRAVTVGTSVVGTVDVQTIDCQSILVHTSLLKRYNTLRFDEKLTFDLYAEDFCINASERLGIKIKVFPLDFQHYSHGNITKRYHDGLSYLAEKYPSVGVAGSCSFIGGNVSVLEKTFQYGGMQGNLLFNKIKQRFKFVADYLIFILKKI